MLYQHICFVGLAAYATLSSTIFGATYYARASDKNPGGCLSAGINDTCNFVCDEKNWQNDFDCGHAGICDLSCEKDKCFLGSIVNATNTLQLNVRSTDEKQCYNSAIFHAPNHGDATFSATVNSQDPFQDMRVSAGSHTKQIWIDCTGGDGKDQCDRMMVNATTAQFLHIDIDDSAFTGPSVIECPQNISIHNTVPYGAPCYINSWNKAKLVDVTIHTLYGMPHDLYMHVDDEKNWNNVLLTCVGIGTELSCDEKDMLDAKKNECWKTRAPTLSPTNAPTQPTLNPTKQPSIPPTDHPTLMPTVSPTSPTFQPSLSPTDATSMPSVSPSNNPTALPSVSPSRFPSAVPSVSPTDPSPMPSVSPTNDPTLMPSVFPTKFPSAVPSVSPSDPSSMPSVSPTVDPSLSPSKQTVAPSLSPTSVTQSPSKRPTLRVIFTATGHTTSGWSTFPPSEQTTFTVTAESDPNDNSSRELEETNANSPVLWIFIVSFMMVILICCVAYSIRGARGGGKKKAVYVVDIPETSVRRPQPSIHPPVSARSVSADCVEEPAVIEEGDEGNEGNEDRDAIAMGDDDDDILRGVETLTGNDIVSEEREDGEYRGSINTIETAKPYKCGHESVNNMDVMMRNDDDDEIMNGLETVGK